MSIASEAYTEGSQLLIKKLYGVEYYEPDFYGIISSKENDLYAYKCYLGAHTIDVEKGDSIVLIDLSGKEAIWRRGPCIVMSEKWAVILRGYAPDNKTSGLNIKTTLPYVNGCSTRQIFPPERLGDPTLQMLEIPACSLEQAHHIHSTPRIVYVLHGRGESIVGMGSHQLVEDLYPGKIVILDKMCPHHFVTGKQNLIVIPLHIFSSIGALENNHPMFNGTHLMNQGA